MEKISLNGRIAICRCCSLTNFFLQFIHAAIWQNYFFSIRPSGEILSIVRHIMLTQGVVHKPRWQDFSFFGGHLCWHFLWYERWHFWTTYLVPNLVNVVCERPPSINQHKSGLGKQQNSIEKNWIIRFGEWQPCVFFGGCCNFFRPPKYDWTAPEFQNFSNSNLKLCFT